MLVAGFAADVGFINLDDAHKLFEFVVLQRRADAVAHVPSRLVATEAHVAVDLPGADALFAGQHQMDHAKPLAQVYIRVFEDRAHKVRKPICPALPTGRTFPPIRHVFEGVDVHAAATRAVDAVGPALATK